MWPLVVIIGGYFAYKYFSERKTFDNVTRPSGAIDSGSAGRTDQVSANPLYAAAGISDSADDSAGPDQSDASTSSAQAVDDSGGSSAPVSSGSAPASSGPVTSSGILPMTQTQAASSSTTPTQSVPRSPAMSQVRTAAMAQQSSQAAKQSTPIKLPQKTTFLPGSQARRIRTIKK